MFDPVYAHLYISAALIIVIAVLFAIVVAYSVVIFTDKPAEEWVPKTQDPIKRSPRRDSFCTRRSGEALSPDFFQTIEEYQRDFA